MTAITEALPDDPGTLKAMIAERARAERLEQINKELQRHRFGRRAEKLPEEQLLLGLEEVEQAVASAEEEGADTVEPTARAWRATRRRLNRGALPAYLPRIEITVDVESQACPCCEGALHRIGEDVSERLDIVPAQLRVLVIRRPKYSCRTCEERWCRRPRRPG